MLACVSTKHIPGTTWVRRDVLRAGVVLGACELGVPPRDAGGTSYVDSIAGYVLGCQGIARAHGV